MIKSTRKEKIGLLLIGCLVFAALIAILFQQPISQDSSYHLFKDTNSIFGVSNFWNVISNLPFLLVGLLGLKNILTNDKLVLAVEIKLAYSLFFSGVALVSLGSSYYHLAPDNQSLLWDRLPMTIAFMALFCIVIGELISIKIAKSLLIPFLSIGALSVFYWYWGEINGLGDLRLYALVQFLPVLCIPIMLIFFKSRFSKTSGYWWLILAYVVAKLLEYLDAEIYDLFGVISGHSLKHLCAALGVYLLLESYRLRERLS